MCIDVRIVYLNKINVFIATTEIIQTFLVIRNIQFCSLSQRLKIKPEETF